MSSVPGARPPANFQEFSQLLNEACLDRDKSVQDRRHSLFKGPVSLEEYVQFCILDIALLSGALQQLAAMLAEREKMASDAPGT